MIMNIGVIKEREFAGPDKRAILLLGDIKEIVKSGCKVYVWKGLGEDIYIPDTEYEKAGAIIVNEMEIIFSQDISPVYS